MNLYRCDCGYEFVSPRKTFYLRCRNHKGDPFGIAKQIDTSWIRKYVTEDKSLNSVNMGCTICGGEGFRGHEQCLSCALMAAEVARERSCREARKSGV